MNKQPIEQARDADLRQSQTALRRAAQRARDVAQSTGTALVVSRDGVIEYLVPSPANTGMSTAASVQEPAARYRDK